MLAIYITGRRAASIRRGFAWAVALLAVFGAVSPTFAACCCSYGHDAAIEASTEMADTAHAHCVPENAPAPMTGRSLGESGCICPIDDGAAAAITPQAVPERTLIDAAPPAQRAVTTVAPASGHASAIPIGSERASPVRVHLIHCTFLI